jgi:hypothetical protein
MALRVCLLRHDRAIFIIKGQIGALQISRLALPADRAEPAHSQPVHRASALLICAPICLQGSALSKMLGKDF